LVENLQRAREQIAEVEEQLYSICQRYKEYELLQTTPGFGPFVSAAVLGAIGFAQRLENARQLLRLAGLVLNASRSLGVRNQPTKAMTTRMPKRLSVCQPVHLRSSVIAKSFLEYTSQMQRDLFV
jgi:transposase